MYIVEIADLEIIDVTAMPVRSGRPAAAPPCRSELLEQREVADPRPGREPLLMARAERRLVEFELVERATILAIAVILAILAVLGLLFGMPEASIASAAGATSSCALVASRRRRR
jgi:hypothetical protein